MNITFLESTLSVTIIDDDSKSSNSGFNFVFVLLPLAIGVFVMLSLESDSVGEHEGVLEVCAILIGDIEANITLILSAHENDQPLPTSTRALSKPLHAHALKIYFFFFTMFF